MPLCKVLPSPAAADRERIDLAVGQSCGMGGGWPWSREMQHESVGDELTSGYAESDALTSRSAVSDELTSRSAGWLRPSGSKARA